MGKAQGSMLNFFSKKAAASGSQTTTTASSPAAAVPCITARTKPPDRTRLIGSPCELLGKRRREEPQGCEHEGAVQQQQQQQQQQPQQQPQQQQPRGEEDAKQRRAKLHEALGVEGAAACGIISSPSSSPSTYPCCKIRDQNAKGGNMNDEFMEDNVVGGGMPGGRQSPAGRAWAEAASKFSWLLPENIRDGQGRRPGDEDFDARTVTVPKAALAKMSASQQQYWETKRNYMDTLLFFKVGTFYELYEVDAEIGHRELDWKMTLSGVGKCRQVGVPQSGIDEAAEKLLARGFKVGRMEQTETSAEAKAKRGANAMVTRCLSHVLSPATMVEGDLRPEAVHLMAIKEVDALPPHLLPHDSIDSDINSSSGSDHHLSSSSSSSSSSAATVVGFAFVDAAARRFFFGAFRDDVARSNLGALLLQVSPQEILFESGGLSLETRRALRRCSRSGGSLPLLLSPMQRGSDFKSPDEAMEDVRQLQRGAMAGAAGAGSVARFHQSEARDGTAGGPWRGMRDEEWAAGMREEEKGAAAVAFSALIAHLKRLKTFDDIAAHAALLPFSLFGSSLRLEGQTIANLELLQNAATGGIEGTLLGHLDFCATAGGKRLLRRWICHPLQSTAEIEARQDAVDDFMRCAELAGRLRAGMRKLPDLERLLARVRGMGGGGSGGGGEDGERQEKAAGPKWEMSAKVLRQKVKTFASAVQGIHDVSSLLSSFSPSLLSSLSPLLRSDLSAADDAAAAATLKTVLDHISWKPAGGAGSSSSGGSKRGGSSGGSRGSAAEEPFLLWQDNASAAGAEDEEATALWHLSSLFNRHQARWSAIADAIARTDVLASFAEAATNAAGPTCRPVFVSEKRRKPLRGGEGGRGGRGGRGGLEETEGGREKGGKDHGRQVDDGSSGGLFHAVGLWHPYARGQAGGALVPNDVLLGGSQDNGPRMRSGSSLGGFPDDSIGGSAGKEPPPPPPAAAAAHNAAAPPNAAAHDASQQNLRILPAAILLTGPNMGGKSTLLRAVCVATIMAQMGCRVPAEQLLLTPADVIFTRLGASDRIMSGESTFLVECHEAAAVLRGATKRSLVVLDELGRGTSTFDGFAIAHAALNHIVNNIGCRMLFATHYHPLTLEFCGNPRLGLFHMACATHGKANSEFSESSSANDMAGDSLQDGEEMTMNEGIESAQDLVFLYKLTRGACPMSYGLRVAKMAGVPVGVVQRASIAAARLEKKIQGQFTRCERDCARHDSDLDLVDAIEDMLLQANCKRQKVEVPNKAHEKLSMIWETLCR